MRLTLLLIPIVLAGLLAGCGNSAPAVETPAAAAATAIGDRNPLEIEVQPDLHLELTVGEPKWQPVAETLSVPGRVEADETRMIRVTSPVGGRIIELNVVEGQRVEKGQIVATIRSTELTSAQTDLLKALTEKQQRDRAVTRAKQLLEAGVIGSAELQRREAEATQIDTELSSLRRQLSVLGITDEAIQQLETTRVINSETHVVAAGAGMVLDRHVTQGQVVQAAEPLCILADLSSVWLVADVPEEHARALRLGKRVQAEIPALPGETFAGNISYISPTVNAETRTILARTDLANPDRRYKPKMLATMLLMGASESRMVVPEGAVVRDGDTENVFLQIGPNKYLFQRVELGEEVPGGRVVLDGLPAGSKIVTDGAFHLNNERRRQNGGGDVATE